MSKSVSNMIKSIVLFGLFIILTFYFVFRSVNMRLFVETIKVSNLWFLLLGAIVMFGYFILDAINLRRVLVSLNNKVKFIDVLKYSFVGFFFSSITPSSTGGQPMQVYYMTKDHINLSSSTITCLVNLACFQISLISLTLLSIIIKFNIFLHCALGLKVMIVVGLLLNGCVLFFSLAAIFSKKIVVYLVKFVIKVLKLFNYKKRDELYVSLMNQVKDYKECAEYLKNNKMIFVKNVLTAFIQMILFHSIPFFVYRALNLSGYSIITFVCVETLLYVSTSALPAPGAVGVSEINFMFLYRILFPAELLSSAMMLSRGINFYLYVLITGLFIIINYIMDKVKNKNITNS